MYVDLVYTSKNFVDVLTTGTSLGQLQTLADRVKFEQDLASNVPKTYSLWKYTFISPPGFRL